MRSVLAFAKGHVDAASIHYRSTNLDFFGNMNQVFLWTLPIIMTLLVDIAAANLTPDGLALIEFKNGLPYSHSRFV